MLLEFVPSRAYFHKLLQRAKKDLKCSEGEMVGCFHRYLLLLDGYSYHVGVADVVEVRLQSPEFEPRKPDFGKLNRLKTRKEEIQRWN